MHIYYKLLPHAYQVPLYATAGASGMDLYAAVQETVEIKPGTRKLIPTGVCIELPKDYELQIRPRSGLALKHGIMVVNSPGTIDDDYRGEIQIILLNTDDKSFYVNRGMRIAQAVLAQVVKAKMIEVEELSLSERDSGGFGSTGT